MTTDDRLVAFGKLRKHLHAIDEAETDGIIFKVRNENPWFTPGSVALSLEGVRSYLHSEKLKKWVSSYTLNPKTIKKIAVVMAGNIPLAGFHDFLSVLISGHSIVMKL